MGDKDKPEDGTAPRPKTPGRNVDIPFPSPEQLLIKAEEIKKQEIKSGRMYDNELGRERLRSIHTINGNSPNPSPSARRRLSFGGLNPGNEVNKRPVTPFKAFALESTNKKKDAKKSAGSTDTSSSQDASDYPLRRNSNFQSESRE